MKELVYLAGCGWAAIFGLSFLVTKSALEAFSPFELLFLRFALATAALLALACLFQPLLYFASETFGLRETATGTAGLILGALPAAVAALSVPMLKERLAPRQAAGLVASVAGIAFVVLVGALASAAFYNVYSRRASASYAPAEIIFAMMASGALAFGAPALIEGTGRGGPSLLARATPAAWGAVAYLGALITLVSLLAGLLLRGEALGPAKALGAAAILAGVRSTNARRRPRRRIHDNSARWGIPSEGGANVG
jgi:drug/metabolite transporter (DMT)-like permease